MTAILLALAAALSFAVSTVVQHRAAGGTPEGTGTVRLLLRLVRNPAWLAALAAAGLGFLLHALALRAGLVVIVAPLLSGGLVLTLVLGALMDRRHPGRPLPGRGQWAAAGVVAGGLALFTTAASPTPGRTTAPAGLVAACVIGTLLAAGAAEGWGRRPRSAHRAAAFGVAAGAGFGITGLLLKEFVGLPPAAWVSSWTTAALLVAGGVAVLMAQRAYQAGPLIESVPVMTVLEPLLAIALAGPLYGERLAPGPVAHTAQLLGALMLAAGLLLLGRRGADADLCREPPGEARQGMTAVG
jgi:drug/metabolite transporter (DMT)-like permease